MLESNESQRRQEFLKVLEWHQRGIFTGAEACRNILFCRIAPLSVEECMPLLSEELRSAMAEYLSSLPVSDQEWAGFEIGGLDGDEDTWAEAVVRCRTAAESARSCLFGTVISSYDVEAFKEKVKEAYRAWLEAFQARIEARRRSVEETTE